MAEPVVLPAFLAEAMFLKLHLLMDIFHAMDVNQDGVLSAEEFIAGMKKRNLTEAQAQQLLALIDANGDGQIELAELLERRHSLSGHASFDTPTVPDESVLLLLKHYALGLPWQAPPSLVPENPAQVAALARHERAARLRRVREGRHQLDRRLGRG